jgi:hypothetical protein
MAGSDLTAGSPLSEEEWERLVRRLRRGECTPFFGTESGFAGVVSRRDLARRLRERFDCPWPASYDLARVTQFISTTRGPLEPAEVISGWLEAVAGPEFSAADNGYRIAAELPFKIYITTTLDGHLLSVMRGLTNSRDAREKLCRWNDAIDERLCVLEQDYSPTPANPLIYRLYGTAATPVSMVLTEDNYLEFLVRATTAPPVQLTSQPTLQPVIPQLVKAAIATGSLIFVGYRFEDLEFRVMVQVILEQLRRNRTRNHVSVQLLHVGDDGEVEERQYQQLQNYYSRYGAQEPLHIRTCWMSAIDFLSELKQRWSAASG